MKLWLSFLGALVAVAWPCSAAPVFYTNELAFHQALDALDYPWFVEGFEGPPWEASRLPGTTGDVVSQGVIWYAEHQMTTSAGRWTRTGDYGLFDTTSTWGDGQAAPSDHLYAAAVNLKAIGGWFQGTGTLRVYDRQSELAGTLALGAPFRFVGVIDPAGLISVEFGGGQFGADDFTVSLVPSPLAPPKVSVAEFSRERGTLLLVQGQWNRTNVVEMSQDLTTWTPISTNVMPTAVCDICPYVYVADAANTNSPGRFYRVVQFE